MNPEKALADSLDEGAHDFIRANYPDLYQTFIEAAEIGIKPETVEKRLRSINAPSSSLLHSAVNCYYFMCQKGSDDHDR